MMNKFGSQLAEYLKYNNISNKDFAERINTTPKNLIDILKGKIELSQNMIYNISFVTDIPVSYIENVEASFKMDKIIDEYLAKENITIKEYINKFNYKEFSHKYHCSFTDERNSYSIAKGILKYLRISNPNSLYKDDNIIFYKSKNDKPELLALWLERCYKVVINEQVGEYHKDNIDIIVNKIKEYAKHNIFNPEELIKLFNANGLYLAIEEDLKGSKIRGAFKVLNNKPAIYITKKYQRYADIYFALLHELAHCKSDFNRAKNGSIISLENESSTEDYELKADETAFNWMVEDNKYNKLKTQYRNIAHLDVIKYSSKIYQDNNKIIK